MVIFQQNTCKTGFFERFHLLFENEEKKIAQLDKIMSLYIYVCTDVQSTISTYIIIFTVPVYTPLLHYIARYL